MYVGLSLAFTLGMNSIAKTTLKQTRWVTWVASGMTFGALFSGSWHGSPLLMTVSAAQRSPSQVSRHTPPAIEWEPQEGHRLIQRLNALPEVESWQSWKPVVYNLALNSLETSRRKWTPGKRDYYANRISDAILENSARYGFDPLFVAAMIHNESQFNPEAKGLVGELGVMQIRPATAKWVIKKQNFPRSYAHQLTDPVVNIRLGLAYLSYLRTQLDFNGRLYVTAYNMGTTKLNQRLEQNYRPKRYVNRVMNRYFRFYREAQRNFPNTELSAELSALSPIEKVVHFD